MLSPRRLLILRALAARGTVASTAEFLGQSASAVSQQLSVLEREVGLPLLDRDGRSVRLTALAEALVAQTEGIVEALEAADTLIHRTQTEITGVLSIAAFPTAAPFVAAACRRLEADHPALRVETIDLEPDEAVLAVARGGVDLAVAHDYGHDPRPTTGALRRTELFSEPLCLFEREASSGTRLADHADRPFAAPYEANACGRAVRSACRAAGFEPRVTHLSNDFTVLLAHVAAGTAIALLPRSAPAGSHIARIDLEDQLERRVFTISRSSRRDHPSIAAARDALAASISQRSAAAPPT